MTEDAEENLQQDNEITDPRFKLEKDNNEKMDVVGNVDIAEDPDNKELKDEDASMSKQLKGYHLVSLLQDNIIRNNGWACLLVQGALRSGKSYATVRLLEKFDPTFAANFRYRCFFGDDSNRLIRAIESIPENVRGLGFMWDEAGVGAYHREWQAKTVQKIIKVIQVSGFKNILLAITLPDEVMLDIDIKRLAGLTLTLKGKDVEKGLSWGKLYSWNKNFFREKIYHKRITIPAKFAGDRNDGKAYIIQKVWFRRPTTNLRRLYDKDSFKWKSEYMKRIANEITELETKKAMPVFYRQIAEEVLKNKDEYKLAKGQWNKDMIKKKFGIDGQMMSKVSQILRAKDLRILDEIDDAAKTKLQKRDDILEKANTEYFDEHLGDI